jgi:hypothetical protein
VLRQQHCEGSRGVAGMRERERCRERAPPGEKAYVGKPSQKASAMIIAPYISPYIPVVKKQTEKPEYFDLSASCQQVSA